MCTAGARKRPGPEPPAALSRAHPPSPNYDAARMQPKTLALVLLAVFSFGSPLAEMLATGRVEMLSTYGLIETAIEVVLLFWWYHLDKAQHDYRAGRLMNAGVLVLAA